MLGIPSSVGVAACSDPETLPLVDAAFARPGSVEAQELKKRFCARCEIAARCLGQAMGHGEFGVWGATSPKVRTKHGGARPKAVPRKAHGPRSG